MSSSTTSRVNEDDDGGPNMKTEDAPEPLDFTTDNEVDDDVDSAAYKKKFTDQTGLTERKRKRGRPRKVTLEEPQAAASGSAPTSKPSASSSSSTTAGYGKTKSDKIRIVGELKKKLYAVGSGMLPTHAHSEKQLDDEIELLLSEIHSSRGKDVIRGGIKKAVPWIEMFIEKMNRPDVMDVSSTYKLSEEVDKNWDDCFAGAVEELSILYGSYFSVGPISEIAKGFAGCVDSCNRKNQKVREKARLLQQHEEAGQYEDATTETPPPPPLSHAV
jgi:hypothetical protein